MTNALVSVIIACHDEMDFLDESIESFIRQTYQNKELIIVVGLSRHNFKEILAKYEKSYNTIKVYHQSQLDSIPKMWNYAVSKAQGKYVINLNPTDVLYSDAIETLVIEAENEHLDVCFGSMIYMDEFGSPLQPRRSHGSPYEFGRLIKGMYLPQPRMCKRSIIDEIGGYDEALPFAADWDFYLRIEENSDHLGWTGCRPLYCCRRYDRNHSNIVDKSFQQAAKDTVRENALRRRNSQKILVVGRKWDESYVESLRKRGDDVISFFEGSPEILYLDQYNWFKPSNRRRFYSIVKPWRRCLKILKKFRYDMIIIKEELPFVLNLIIQYKTKGIRKKSL